MFDTYRRQRPTWGEGQYLVDTGTISSPQRLEDFLQEIGTYEIPIMEEREKKEAEYRKKADHRNRRRNTNNNNNNSNTAATTTSSAAEIAKQEQAKQASYYLMLSNLSSISDSYYNNNNNNADEDDTTTNCYQSTTTTTTTTEDRGKDYKGRYYFEKLGFTPADLSKHRALQQSYLEGLLWCLAYYYRGCISWGWFFPYHYGPMLSDLKDLTTIISQITFDLSEPLKPFQQLMGCLPPASSALVPPPYRKLMTSPTSPIQHFYPNDFQKKKKKKNQMIILTTFNMEATA